MVERTTPMASDADHSSASDIEAGSAPTDAQLQAGNPVSSSTSHQRQNSRNNPGSNGVNRPAQNRPARARRAYAAIDLGTNNCRLLIAKPAADSFVVVDAFSRVVRLGEGLANKGKLSQQAMDRAVAALSVCADKLKRRNVCLARSVATEACRRASNGEEFIERVRRETGIMLDIISAEEEARLAVLGCHILLEPGQGPALIFDIGGGSTELVLIDTDGRAPEIRDWVSVPYGVVSLTESVDIDASSSESRIAGYEKMRSTALDSFRAFAERLPHKEGDNYRMLGTSGTVTTLASLHLKLPCYNRSAIDGLIVPAQSMRDISQKLGEMHVDERSNVPCIGKERADLVIAGCAILEAILDIWPAERLGVADRGIREGILRGLMATNSMPKSSANRKAKGNGRVRSRNRSPNRGRNRTSKKN
ncbi:MAG: Ppx/GppA phosphatase family protein [Pseudomonadota bacterium]